MLIKENLNTVSLRVPVTLRARLTVKRELVQRQIRGEQIGTLSELFVPTSARTLTTLLTDGAKQFVGDMAKKGKHALTPPEQFIVFGPYQYRPTSGTTGWAQNEDPYPESCDFVIEGQFLATRGKVPELPDAS